MNTADRRFWIQGLIGKKVSFLVYFMIQAPGKKFPFSVQYIGSDLMKNTDVTSHTYTRLTKTTVVLPRGRSISVTGGDNGIIVFSKIGVVVYYQCCVLIGWASEKSRIFGGKKRLKCCFKLFCLDIFDQLVGFYYKTIISLAPMASDSIAHSAFGLMGYWLRAHSGSMNNC